jgi:thiamine biosynthesis lipoprotein
LRSKRIGLILLLGSVALISFYCFRMRREQTVTQSRFALGTVIEITATGIHPDRAVSGAFRAIRRVERLTASGLAAINHEAGGKSVKVAPEILEILTLVQKYYSQVSGAFDPTVGPLTELWGFGRTGEPHLPDAAKIRATLPLIGFNQVEIDRPAQTVRLKQPGMRLDLGGVAKGYAIDRAYQSLRQAGIQSALINAGTSSIRVIGKRRDGQAWRIGIGHPRRNGELLGILPLASGRSLSTSADTQNYFIRNRVRYSHLLNPKTGYPARDKILVSVTAPTAAESDLLSTALFMLPPDQIRTFLAEHPGIKAILADRKLRLVNRGETGFRKQHGTPGND